MKNIGLITLTKTFSNKEYAENFLDGKLRFMPLNYYTELEGDLRKDNYEGISLIFQPELSKIKIDGIELKSSELASPILVRENKDKMHVFCMSAIYYKDIRKFDFEEEKSLENIKKPCKRRLREFGEITVIIKDIKKFLTQIDNAIEKNKLYSRKFVKYVELKKMHGNVKEPGFVKDLEYEKENEYRFSLKGLESEEPFILEIGSIRDIATIIPTNSLDVSIQIEKLK